MEELRDTKWLQVRVDKGLWKAIATRALEVEDTVSGVVRGVLEKEFGVRAGVSEPTDAEVLGKCLVSKSVPRGGFSEGKRVVVAQGKVVEPEFKCRVCGKPTNGDFVCKECVK